jgi:hypothetical protein
MSWAWLRGAGILKIRHPARSAPRSRYLPGLMVLPLLLAGGAAASPLDHPPHPVGGSSASTARLEPLLITVRDLGKQMRCDFVGGATYALGGKRVNYSCAPSGGFPESVGASGIVLIGLPAQLQTLYETPSGEWHATIAISLAAGAPLVRQRGFQLKEAPLGSKESRFYVGPVRAVARSMVLLTDRACAGLPDAFWVPCLYRLAGRRPAMVPLTRARSLAATRARANCSLESSRAQHLE